MNYIDESPVVVNMDNQSNPNEIILNDNLEFWMTNLPPYLKSLPIINLAIPGKYIKLF